MNAINEFSNVANGFSRMAYDVNSMGTNMNMYNAMANLDPIQRKLANDRVFCTNKFYWYQLKTTFFMNILPFIVMFLMAFMSQYIKIHGGIFLLIILWIIFGAIYTIYLRAWKWNVVQYNINTSFDINPNNCGFEK